MARAKHEADEQIYCRERAGAQPSSEEGDGPPPSAHQLPDGHDVDARGFKESVGEDERVNVAGKGGELPTSSQTQAARSINSERAG